MMKTINRPSGRVADRPTGPGGRTAGEAGAPRLQGWKPSTGKPVQTRPGAGGPSSASWVLLSHLLGRASLLSLSLVHALSNK